MMNVSLVRPAIFLGGCGIEKGHPWIFMKLVFATNFGTIKVFSRGFVQLH